MWGSSDHMRKARRQAVSSIPHHSIMPGCERHPLSPVGSADCVNEARPLDDGGDTWSMLLCLSRLYDSMVKNLHFWLAHACSRNVSSSIRAFPRTNVGHTGGTSLIRFYITSGLMLDGTGIDGLLARVN